MCIEKKMTSSPPPFSKWAKQPPKQPTNEPRPLLPQPTRASSPSLYLSLSIIFVVLEFYPLFISDISTLIC